MRKNFLIPQKDTDWKNACEFEIGQHKIQLWSLDKRFQVPYRLWYWLIIYTDGTQIITVTGNKKKSSLEDLLNTRPEISDYIDF